MKNLLILNLILIFSLASCVQQEPIVSTPDEEIESQDSNSLEQLSNFTIYGAKFNGAEIVVSGKNLHKARFVSVTDSDGNRHSLNIKSSSNSQLVLEAISNNVRFIVGKVMSLAISNAYGQVSGYNFSVVLESNSIQAQHFSHMGASNGDVLVFNSNRGKWEPKALSAGGGSLQGLWNASTNEPQLFNGGGRDIYPSNGDYFIVQTAGNTYLDGNTSWKIGDWIIYNSQEEKWHQIQMSNESVVWSQVDKSNSSLNDLGDVDLTGVKAGSILKYNGSKWIAVEDIVASGDDQTQPYNDAALKALINGNAANITLNKNSITALTTDQVTEGSNLYFTNQKAQSAVIANNISELNKAPSVQLMQTYVAAKIAEGGGAAGDYTPTPAASFNAGNGIDPTSLLGKIISLNVDSSFFNFNAAGSLLLRNESIDSANIKNNSIALVDINMNALNTHNDGRYVAKSEVSSAVIANNISELNKAPSVQLMQTYVAAKIAEGGGGAAGEPPAASFNAGNGIDPTSLLGKIISLNVDARNFNFNASGSLLLRNESIDSANIKNNSIALVDINMNALNTHNDGRYVANSEVSSDATFATANNSKLPNQLAIKSYVDNKFGTASRGDFLKDGTVAMTGDLDMGGRSITNVNFVDGINLSTINSLSSNIKYSNLSVAIGPKALDKNGSGDANIAIGHNALEFHPSALSSVAIGSYAMNKLTSGRFNTAIGTSSQRNSVDASNNTSLGAYSLGGVAGSDNVAIGTYALTSATSSENTVIGSYAGRLNTSGSRNTSLGAFTLRYNTTGSQNVGIGYNSLFKNTTAHSNVAIGTQSMEQNTTGGSNVAIGTEAMKDGISGNGNVAVGNGSLTSNTSGSSNVAVGANAGRLNLTGNGNLALGVNALYKSASGDTNIAIGNQALSSQTGVDGTIAIGANALKSNLSGGSNTAVGWDALRRNTTASRNTALGNSTLSYATTGDDNTALGAYALQLTTTGFQNVAIGTSALVQNTIGFSNVAIGYDAAKGATNLTHTIAIGKNALRNSTGGNENIAIGYRALQDTDNTSSNIGIGSSSLRYSLGDYNIAIGRSSLSGVSGGGSADSDFNVGIGYASLYKLATGRQNTALGTYAGYNSNGSGNVFIGYQAGYHEKTSNKLYIANSTTSTPLIYGNFGEEFLSAYVKINGNLEVSGGTISNTSDQRFKDNIETLDGGLEKIKSIRGASYYWNDLKKQVTGTADEELQIGVIAQELLPVLPELVVKDKETGYYSVNYMGLIPYLIEAVKEEDAKIAKNAQMFKVMHEGLAQEVAQNSRAIASLEEENRKLKGKVDMLTKYLCAKDQEAVFCK